MKIGSRQKAAKGFIAVCTDTILDWWIPDKDWVRQIQDNGEHDFLIVNFNRDMSTQCMLQNNQATLQGKTILYNNKNVWTNKNKATANKPIRFYYVFWLVSQLQLSPATKASNSCNGMIPVEATAPSREKVL